MAARCERSPAASRAGGKRAWRGALWAVWAGALLGGWGCGDRDRPAPAPPESAPASLAVDFRGDSVGYSARSAVLRSLRPGSRTALLTLANAQLVFSRAPHLDGTTPQPVAAFDLLARERVAPFAFAELVREAPPVGQIYGLCGLYRLRSPNFFLAQAHLLRESPARVWRKPSYDLFEQVTTHEVANDLRYCQFLVPPHEELLEEPPRR